MPDAFHTFEGCSPSWLLPGFQMFDNKPIKALGLRFARALQMTVKTAVMFTVEHKSVERPIQQSFLLLNNLLKETGQFTFGFIDNQVMLNNVLTTDTSLRNLETEFLKRGIAAVTFEPGLTLGRYKKVINVLAVPSKTIDETGGLLSFLDQNELEGARILPAAKNQKKDEHGDTIIETDSESYILSKQMAEEQSGRDFLDSIDALLESACFDPSTRGDVLADFATQGVDGTGYGVPVGVPQLVVLKDGETIASNSDAEPGTNSQTGSNSTGHPIASGDSVGNGGTFGVPGGHGRNLVSRGTPRDGISALSGGLGGNGGPGGDGSGLGFRRGGVGSSSFMELVEASVQRSLLEEEGNPQKSYTSLARILRNMGVDKVLAHFPAERRQELSTLPPEQLAGEYIADTALQIAGTKLKAAEGSSQKLLVEEDVVRVLARSLQATHMADRLAQKLAQFIQDFAVPQHMQEKIREELHWSALHTTKKYSRLMELKHYSPTEFRRLTDLLKELIAQREVERANALAAHYFDFLDDAGAHIDPVELGRVPDLIRSVPLAHAGFASKTTERLTGVLLRDSIPEFSHMQVASALTVLSQAVAAFEGFQAVQTIGAAMETSLKRDPSKHKRCCEVGLSRLLPAAAIERIIELYLQQRGDSAWSKTASSLLRFGAPDSIVAVFSHLIEERDARNRLALVRIVGQLGPASVQIAYKYMKDDRWYVVRNICGILVELKDPDLADHITPALEHPDARVQQAALKALLTSRTVRAAPVLAASLSKLAPNVVDEALDELMFLRHVKTVGGLEEFIAAGKITASSRKALQVLAAIDDDEALHALARLFHREQLDNKLRRAALNALCQHQSPVAVDLLQQLAAAHGPLGEEARAELKARTSS
jgi:HEAT repeat protein